MFTGQIIGYVGADARQNKNVCGDVYADVFQKDDGSHIPSVSLTVSRIELLGKAEKKESGDGTASGQPQ